MTDDLARAADAWAELPAEDREDLLIRLDGLQVDSAPAWEALQAALKVLRAAELLPSEAPAVAKPYPVGTYLRDERDGDVVKVLERPNQDEGIYTVDVVLRGCGNHWHSALGLGARSLHDPEWSVVAEPR